MLQPAPSACEHEDGTCAISSLGADQNERERPQVDCCKSLESWGDGSGEASTEGGSTCSEAGSVESSPSPARRSAKSRLQGALAAGMEANARPDEQQAGEQAGEQQDRPRKEEQALDATQGEVRSEELSEERSEELREADLAAREEDLRKAVPKLLDSMNRASEEVNTLERQVNTAQERYSSSVAECNRVYEELRAKNGRDFDRVKPYFSAVEEVRAASHRLQTIAREFSSASSRHSKAKEEGRPPDEVQQLQKDRENCEAQYVCALKHHRTAQEVLETLRSQLGGAIIQRSLPAFQTLQEYQLQLVVEHSRMNTLTERAAHSKQGYQKCMRELEHISMAVHNIRRVHGQQSSQ